MGTRATLEHVVCWYHRKQGSKTCDLGTCARVSSGVVVRLTAVLYGLATRRKETAIVGGS